MFDENISKGGKIEKKREREIGERLASRIMWRNRCVERRGNGAREQPLFKSDHGVGMYIAE